MVTWPRLGALPGRACAAVLLGHEPWDDPPGLKRARASPRRPLALMWCSPNPSGSGLVSRHDFVTWQCGSGGELRDFLARLFPVGVGVRPVVEPVEVLEDVVLTAHRLVAVGDENRDLVGPHPSFHRLA